MTELPLLEHTTDSHGQTLATFAMFDLVDKRLSPRIAKLTENSSTGPERPATTRPGRWRVRCSTPRPNRPDRRTMGRPTANRRVAQTGLRVRRAADRQAPGRLQAAPAVQGDARIRQNACGPSTRCAGSPTRRSGGGSAYSSTAARHSTTCAASSSSPTAGPSATPTTKTRRPRRTATPSSSTSASSPRPATSKTPCLPSAPTGAASATRRSPTSAPASSRRSTPTAP